MQALYGFEQAKSVNYQLGVDRLKRAFDADWNDERSEELNAERVEKATQAVQVFRQHYQDEQWLDTTLPADVRRAVQLNIKEYHESTKNDAKGFQNGLMREVHRLYDNYLLILALPHAVVQFVNADRENLRTSYMRKDDQKGDYKFIENSVVKFLANNDLLQVELKRRNLSWTTHEEILRDFYRNTLREDKTYQQYNQSKLIGFEEEREMIAHIYRNLVFTQQNLIFFSLKEFDIKRFELENMAKAQGIEPIRLQILKTADELFKSTALKIGVETEKIQTWAEEFQKHLKEFAQHLHKAQNQALEKEKEKPAQQDSRAPRPRIHTPRESDGLEREFAQDIRRLHAILREASQVLVGKLSLCLEAVGMNLLDNQRANLDYIEEALHTFLETFGLGKHPTDKITLQIENEKGSSLLQDLLNEIDYNWLENGKVVQNMVMKTVRMFDAPLPSQFALVELSANWDEDKGFYQELFSHSMAYGEQAEAQLVAKSQNWDVSRMAEIDRVIMKMAIAEMEHFNSIPIKVTINEYLEIAKLYSTPRSKPFINGMLDQVAQSMQEEGLIRKSGRGLMDNK